MFEDDKKQHQEDHDEEAPRSVGEFDLPEIMEPAPTPANADDHMIY